MHTACDPSGTAGTQGWVSHRPHECQAGDGFPRANFGWNGHGAVLKISIFWQNKIYFPLLASSFLTLFSSGIVCQALTVYLSLFSHKGKHNSCFRLMFTLELPLTLGSLQLMVPLTITSLPPPLSSWISVVSLQLLYHFLVSDSPFTLPFIFCPTEIHPICSLLWAFSFSHFIKVLFSSSFLPSLRIWSMPVKTELLHIAYTMYIFNAREETT